MQPDGAAEFSVLEGQPHNKVHNCIGGVGAIDPGPYGNMTNFLSPVDPIFFLHHANMDRLWDVWTRKQIAVGQPIGPDEDDEAAFMDEPFLFYIGADGQPVGPNNARRCSAPPPSTTTTRPPAAADTSRNRACVVCRRRWSHRSMPTASRCRAR